MATHDRGSSLVMLDFVPLVGTYFLSQSYDNPELLTLEFSMCSKINTGEKKKKKKKGKLKERKKLSAKTDFRTEEEPQFATYRPPAETAGMSSCCSRGLGHEVSLGTQPLTAWTVTLLKPPSEWSRTREAGGRGRPLSRPS